MFGSRYARRCAGRLLAGAAIVTLGFAAPAAAQLAPDAVTHTPPFTHLPEERCHPGETYDSLQAGQDAYHEAEAQRRGAIGWQLQVQDQIRWLNTWMPPHRPQPILPDLYASTAPPGAVSRGYRGGYVATFDPWPRVPGDIWGYPYYGAVRQPTGHEKIWTGPGSYIYKPRYDPPPAVRTGPPAPRPVPGRAEPRAGLAPPRAGYGGAVAVPPPPWRGGPGEEATIPSPQGQPLPEAQPAPRVQPGGENPPAPQPPPPASKLRPADGPVLLPPTSRNEDPPPKARKIEI